MNTTRMFGLAVMLASLASPVAAQDHDHHEAAVAEPVEEIDHAAKGHGVPSTPVEVVDHAAMGHDMPAEPVEEVDHSAMGHGAPVAALTPVPPVTAADRAAAVKPPGGHAAHDNGVFQFVLIDRLESSWSDGEHGQAWEVEAWRGTDLNRLWLRSEGERAHGDTEHASVELLYGRSVSPWWDVVGGVRHDFGEGPSQTMAAFGVQGLAPYKYEFAATAYLGRSGQSALNLEAEYDTLLTNRLILQWHAEAEFWGRDDPERGIGSGLNSIEAGLRLRYEIRREFAPYVGVAWERRFGDAADAVELEGGDASEARVVAGFRFWF